MTNDELTQAFIAAGFDTPAKVTTMLQMANAQMKRNALLIKREGLAQKQAAANQAIENERQQLTTLIETETAVITAGV